VVQLCVAAIAAERVNERGQALPRHQTAQDAFPFDIGVRTELSWLLAAHPGMSTEVKKEIQLEIAHVLFTDIVGYSKLLIDEQHALLETLNQIVRSTDQFRKAEAAGKLIKIPTGDGMALVFQDRLEAPVECALEISRALKEHPTLPLRMGVHSLSVRLKLKQRYDLHRWTA
jgi:class 3 adenylate cyclase